jgi:AraC-like DNA-binding protein
MEMLAEIRAHILRHTRAADVVAPLPGVRLLAARAPTEPVNGIYEPVFALIAQGAKRTVLGERVFNYADGQYLVVSVALPIAGHVVQASREEPYLSFALTLKPAAIAALLLETAAGERGGAEAPGLAVSVASSELLDPVARLLRLVDRPGDAAVLAPMLEREILWRLLAGEQGALVRQIGLADSSLSQISRAIQWIRGHYADMFRVEELARDAGMSAATFYRHFKAVTSMSPLQYQKQIRLQEARARLIADGRDVASIGYDVGYDSPSQFSREYRRMFGAPPGRDLVRLRLGAPLEGNLA